MKEFDATTYKDAKGDFNTSDEALLTDFISSDENKSRILDVGCGDGKLTRRIKDKFPASEIIGIDNSSGQIELTKSIEGVRFELSDILEYKSEKFDLIYAFYSFPHIPKNKLVHALRVVKSLLKEDCTFYLFTNICLFDTSLATKEEQEACDVVFLNNWPSQINLVSIEEMRSMFAEVGFSEVKNIKLETGAKIKNYGDMISWTFVLK